MEVKDFRPISPLESVYKIISKILTEIKVISKLISGNQFAFIKERQIVDDAMVAK